MVAVVLSTSAASAQTGGVQQELIARGYAEYAEEVEGPADLYLGLIRMEPGARYGGWHAHPGTIWLVVRAGELAVYGPDGCRTVYGPGSAYASVPNAAYDLWNEGPIAVEIAFSGVIRAGEPATVPVDPPAEDCGA
jgi:quercetin dioxygenase-like cupin family protein